MEGDVEAEHGSLNAKGISSFLINKGSLVLI